MHLDTPHPLNKDQEQIENMQNHQAYNLQCTSCKRFFLSSPVMSSNVQLYQQSPYTGGSIRALHAGKPGMLLGGGSPS